jgi:hypothetical protein
MNFCIWCRERTAWWKPGRRGYTKNINEAGIYSEQETNSILSQANIIRQEEWAIPLEAVENMKDIFCSNKEEP